jgi:hypothetical protein
MRRILECTTGRVVRVRLYRRPGPIPIYAILDQDTPNRVHRSRDDDVAINLGLGREALV